MAYKIGQIINDKNEETVTTSGGINIVQLGVQAPKGSIITLKDIVDNQIIMGEMGIFEIPQNLGITVAKVSVALPSSIKTITGNEIIIDYLYEDNGGGTEI